MNLPSGAGAGTKRLPPLHAVIAIGLVAAGLAVANVRADDTFVLTCPEQPKVASARCLGPGLHLLDDPTLVGLTENVSLAQDGVTGRPCWAPAGGAPGILRTPYLTFVAGNGSRFLLDADAGGGEIRLQVRDAYGNLIPGFSFGDCAPVTGQGSSVPVAWYAASGKVDAATDLTDLSRLDRQSVSLEFRLQSARLFGFSVEPGQELPLRVGDGPHLFVDDFLVAESENLRRVMNHPRRLLFLDGSERDPKALADRPAVGTALRELTLPNDVRPLESYYPAYGPVIWDPQLRLFRTWDNVQPPPGMRHSIVYRETRDPLHPVEQAQPAFMFNGYYGTEVIDDGPNCPEPARRFKTAFFVIDPPTVEGPTVIPFKGTGLYVAFSPDGVHWEPCEGNPVLPYYPQGDPRWSWGVGDIVDPFYDPIRRQYGCFIKVFPTSDKEFNMNSLSVREGLGVRMTGQSVSPDFMHWETQWRVFVPEAGDPGTITEFHGARVVSRGDLLIAFVNHLQGDVAADPGGPVGGIGWVDLAISRDGRHWQRFHEPFLDRGSRPGAPDRGRAWIGQIHRRGDRIYFVFSGNSQGFKSKEGSVGNGCAGLAVVGRDRFVAREARGRDAGRLVTHLLSCRAGEPPGLWLNAGATGGEIRVQLRNAEGRILPGFAFEDCHPVVGNGYDQPVLWGRSLAEVGGAPFRLEFSLRNARLYGFSFAPRL